MNEENIPTIELFIKASPSDKLDKGACPLSQKWFMAFLILVEKGLIHLRLTVVTPENPPPSYAVLDVARRLPVAMVIDGCDPITGKSFDNYTADTDDEIEALMNRWQCPELRSNTSSAFHVVEDLYRNFNTFLKQNHVNPMLLSLRKLEAYLGSVTSPSSCYLEGDHLAFTDCQLMPKLQHLRVACAEFKNFHIPSEFRNLWSYMARMYETPAFQQTCPADRDILIHYFDKVRPAPPNAAPPTLSGNTITSYIPEEIKLHECQSMNHKKSVAEQDHVLIVEKEVAQDTSLTHQNNGEILKEEQKYCEKDESNQSSLMKSPQSSTSEEKIDDRMIEKDHIEVNQTTHLHSASGRKMALEEEESFNFDFSSEPPKDDNIIDAVKQSPAPPSIDTVVQEPSETPTKFPIVKDRRQSTLENFMPKETIEQESEEVQPMLIDDKFISVETDSGDEHLYDVIGEMSVNTVATSQRAPSITSQASSNSDVDESNTNVKEMYHS